MNTARTNSSGRFLSLDALRGLAILLMLLVNNFGTADVTPGQLVHTGWQGGIHLADMAFPWFLFCLGVTIPFSSLSARGKGVQPWKYDLRVLRRTIILLALGALLDSVGDHRLVIFSIGILQTIGIAYFLSALLYDLPVHRRLFFAAAALVGYWAAIKYMPMPGAAAGTFEENRNFILYLNRTYFGPFGLWNLSRIVPTTALVLIGTAIGDMIVKEGMESNRKAAWLVASGIGLIVGGYLWALSLPFNKPVWTPSYILLSAGTGTLLLGVFYVLIDIKGWRNWALPLIVFGSNAILVYVLPIVLKETILIPTHLYIIGWLRVILFITFWWVIAWLLYRKRIFLRV
jgi:predicted acyltransferase